MGIEERMGWMPDIVLAFGWFIAGFPVRFLRQMNSIHYTHADPQALPLEMIDMVLPEDIYRLGSLQSKEELDEEMKREEEEEELAHQSSGVVALVGKVAPFPLNLLVFLIENWVDGTLGQTLKKTFS